MREIKFRAWDVKSCMYSIPAHLMNIHTGQISNLPERFILEQSTGVLDVNGKEIYEGDVVHVLYTDWPSKPSWDKRSLEEYLKQISIRANIEYDEQYACYRLVVDGTETSGIYPGEHGRIEVIGNIHENPELLNA